MTDQPRGPLLRTLAAVAAGGLLLTACAGADDATDPSRSEPTSSGPRTPSATASTPGPSESASLYTHTTPGTDTEGQTSTASASLRTFAKALSTDDRSTVESMLHSPTPEDPTIVDQSMRTLAGTDWDFDGARWTEGGFLGPCYLLDGTVEDEPVHIAGSMVWNDALNEWEFTTDGLPGSEDYPDLPAC